MGKTQTKNSPQTITGLKWLLPWPQMEQVNPSTFFVVLNLSCEVYWSLRNCKVIHQHAARLTHIRTHTPALEEHFLYLSAFGNFLSLTSPTAQISHRYPLCCSPLTLLVLDLVECVLLISTSFTLLSSHVHFIFFFSVILVCLTAYQCPLSLICCPAVLLHF